MMGLFLSTFPSGGLGDEVWISVSLFFSRWAARNNTFSNTREVTVMFGRVVIKGQLATPRLPYKVLQ